MSLSNKRFYGLYGAAKAWLIGDLVSKNRKLVVVCPNRKSQETLASDLRFFIPETPILTLYGWDTLPFEEVSPDISVSAERLKVLLQAGTLNSYVLITAPDALYQKLIPKPYLEALAFSVSKSEAISRQTLINQLDSAGYLRTSLVEGVGEYAVRGGVIDVFSPTGEFPVRLEFIDDVIDEIRLFDPDNQRSTVDLVTAEILPVREVLQYNAPSPFENLLPEAIATVKQRGKLLETPPREIARIMNALKTGTYIPGIEVVQYLALPTLQTVFNYIPTDAQWVVQDEIGVQQMLDDLWSQAESREERLTSEHHLIPEKERIFLDPENTLSDLQKKRPAYFDQLELFQPDADQEPINLRTSSNGEVLTRFRARSGAENTHTELGSYLSEIRRKNFSIAFVVGSSVRAERLNKILLDLQIEAHSSYLSGIEWLQAPKRHPIAILQGNISEGFQLPTKAAVFIAEHEIFSERSYRKSKQRQYSLKKILSSLAQLSEGDFVVHADYGIGIYRGLRHFDVEDSAGDFLHIEYADSRLYVPVQNIGRVQKFTAAEGQSPALDKLASTRWIKTKAKVRESVAQLAGDLIRLYASRSVSKGWRYEPMGAEDDRFADGFPYDETVDQMKAIEDTLKDMADDRVMDRLVCGDVGFGKTEVAIRAAFKCVQHRRQVAVLVPTTILVDQHRKSFLNRFAEYKDVRIEAISRFNTPQENKKILEGLKTGDVDVIIGTHRLLSRDVQFGDLGLVIIDEEHRFGVQQKERLKSLKRSVDVLTLTATPIPRTMHMSLLGIRDISVISTPPQDRRVIRTYIANHDEAVVRDAIIREIQRGGQAFFLHNRVQSIDLVTAELAHLVPEARFQFAHGQMTEAKLEAIMTDFIDQKFDVLVSTTIIESGIDIPNANTIIIDRADTFGLAQLYQLRGRVGRSTRQAYAYMLVPKAKKLGAEARQRLKALQALDDLGLGFNLAMRDLEIRGAGNLLGKEQSGNVLAVGFDLYTKILKEAVLNQKGEELDLEETIDPEVKIAVNAYIPDWYIPDVSERLLLYQRLSSITSDEDAHALQSEIEDRFGPINREVNSLIELMRYRALLRHFGILKAELQNSAVNLSFSKRAPVDIEKILAVCKKNPDRFRFGKNLTLSMRIDRDRIDDASDIYPATWELLHAIKQGS